MKILFILIIIRICNIIVHINSIGIFVIFKIYLIISSGRTENGRENSARKEDNTE
jgi:hypothetical protein